MKTQVSRDSFNRDKRYSGVYLQQGRMITDSDWNEEAEIAKRRLDDALADAISSGVPREHGVRIEAISGQPLRLSRGRLYTEGVGALVSSTLADPTLPFGLGEQADFPLPDAAAPPATSYRLYADVWERAVTSLEDSPQLRDPAFQGADTASRTQTMAQLKWCDATVDPEAPAVNPPIGDARLTLTLRQQFAGNDPCDPCAAEITVLPRVGNFLFRLEVHAVEGGAANPTRLTLKWSSENGAEQHAVGTEPDDFKGTDWTYEYFTTRTEKHLGIHLAGGIAPVTAQLLEGFPEAPPDGFAFVRRWDGYCILRRTGSTWSLVDGRERGVDLSTDSAADADGHVSLAGGAGSIQLSTLSLDLDLANRTFVAGDYWLAAVREAVHKPGDTVLDDAPPAGIRHHYLLLATISSTGTAVAPDTNRQQRLDFPSLTSLAARDVDYAASCPSGLFDATHDTVQKALDRVCSIDATHIGFTKTCSTSIFQGVDAASVNTVAKVLALLCDVRAEQIAYSANCPSGLFRASDNTVKKALDRVCSLDATQVAFTPPACNDAINIWRGADPAQVNTVAKALALFCDLRAEHVHYTNQDDCTALAGVTTVQEALHRLCIRESGSGCRTTIGEGGEFLTLKQAVDAFKARGETRYCFCLLPGVHVANEAITVDPPQPDQRIDFSLEGSGPASRLVMTGSLVFSSTSVQLSNLAIDIGPDARLIASKGEEVVVEGCTITVPPGGATSPISLSAARLVRLTGNDVQALDFARTAQAVGILGAEPLLSRLFAPTISEQKFAVDAHQASIAVAAQSATKRRSTSTAIQKQITLLQNTDGVDHLTPEEEGAFGKIIQILLSTGQTLQADLEQALSDLREVLILSPDALAVVLGFEGGDAILVDNHILGVLSIYGEPGLTVLNDAELGQIRRQIIEGKIRLIAAAEESLFLARNRVSKLSVAGDLIEQLRQISPLGGQVSGLFRSGRLTENVFTLGSNDLLCVEANLTGNRFAAMVDAEGISGRLGSVVAQEAFYVGNHGPQFGVQGFLQEASGRFNINTAGDLNTAFIHDAH